MRWATSMATSDVFARNAQNEMVSRIMQYETKCTRAISRRRSLQRGSHEMLTVHGPRKHGGHVHFFALFHSCAVQLGCAVWNSKVERVAHDIETPNLRGLTAGRKLASVGDTRFRPDT